MRENLEELLNQERAERKRIAQQLRETQIRHQALIEHLPVITYIAEFGVNGKWVFVSPQIAKILGYSTSEWIANVGIWTERLDPRDRDRVLKEELISHKTGNPFQCEYRILARDGRVVWVHDEAVVIKDEEGTPLFLQGIISDICKRKEMEESLREHQEQLLQSQKIETVGRLAGGIAHDFNNLLMAISGYCELIGLKYRSDPILLQHVSEIEKAADHGASLTRQLLAFGRKQVLSTKALNLNRLILKMQTMISRLIGDHIQLSVNLQDDLATIVADPGQLEQVIMNLVVNAHDAMPEGGNLRIETQNVELTRDALKQFPALKQGKYVLLSITDTGVGMDEETKSRIFEPFFTTKGVGKGTGLGLATVYGIIRQSGGDISVVSATGKGTSFSAYLPAAQNVICDAEVHEERPSIIHTGNECILLVDDNHNLRSAIARSLDMHGYTVLQASDGEEALSVSSNFSGEIQVLVTDVVMPSMSGTELAKRLLLERPNIKILYMSGYSSDSKFFDGKLGTGRLYLQKPASIVSVLQNIRRLVDDDQASDSEA